MKESARARMRMLIKKLLKKYKYPPEGQEDAIQTVMTQCELWTDNVMETEHVIYQGTAEDYADVAETKDDRYEC